MDKQELEKLIKEKEYLFLKEKLEKTNEVDIAELLEPLDIHTTLLIFRMLAQRCGCRGVCRVFCRKTEKTLSVWQQTKN
ncbi:hypothetical protein [Syntrophaceticus schinkii]|uniref:Uncharacterized protein n=1 Tax=Syntrophaceticus schinkii TaxID=499207 RepID=A0A0B7MK96_9FIRM|nr:hypothetical protein [Syntrophaceticus schinkii]CEO88603.1 hypothetical protein SSCH_220009 [Syntrophaceticus schinkii]